MKNKNMKEQPQIEQPKIEPEKGGVEKYNNVKLLLESKIAEEAKYPNHQARTLGVSIIALERVYPNELDRLKRIVELGKVYKEEFLKQKEANSNKDEQCWSAKTMAQISKSILTENEKRELERSKETEKSRLFKSKESGGMIAFVPDVKYSLGLLLEGVGKLNLDEIEKSTKENPKIETPSSAKATEGKKEKRLKYEIELEQRPQPLEGEAFDVWLKRIGGPNVKVEKIGRCKKCNDHTYIEDEAHLCEASIEQRKSLPMMITKNGDFLLNNENIGNYFDKEKIDKNLGEKNSNITFLVNTRAYLLRKELFQRPDIYFRVIAEELKEKRKIVADKRFGESLDKWVKELKGEKVEKKPASAEATAGKRATEGKEERPKPEKEKKPPTLDEQIIAKQKELEKAEEGQALYSPVGWFRRKPAVRDLGYYANEAQIKDLRKEIQDLKQKKEKAEVITQKEKKEEAKKTGVISVGGGGTKIEEPAEEIEKRLQELSTEIRESTVLGRSKLEKEQKKLEKRLKKLKKIKKLKKLRK